MAKKFKIKRPRAHLPKGLRDIESHEVRYIRQILETIGDVYELYGFDPLETPALEYTDALGKFLPDSDRPNEGVFSLQDENKQWMSLRYDMTAPLARYVAENYQHINKPLRRYTSGPVWRNEKPGPGRFRQFMQFDADTVGTTNIAADAEICMLAAETMERLGFDREDYIIRLNNRKVLDSVLISIGINHENQEQLVQRLTILRALDKIDRIGIEGVKLLLGEGRKDESGDFTKGAGLDFAAIKKIVHFLDSGQDTRTATIKWLAGLVGDDVYGREGIEELQGINELLLAAGFNEDRITIDPSLVRGLDYYTGPVFEADLTFEIKNEREQAIHFGSVGGGGRYDDLVARFTGKKVPATGFSFGVSRLQSALMMRDGKVTHNTIGPVIVLVLDRSEQSRYQNMVQKLRAEGIRAEMYIGTSGIKAQMKYADNKCSPCVVIQGNDERAAGKVQIKDLVEGARLSKAITDSKEWRKERPAQFSIPEAELVAAVKTVISRYETNPLLLSRSKRDVG
ncbi:MAG: Histidine--tRNA ligase [Hyphomicrobiaceae bacterium hypho_1]